MAPPPRRRSPRLVLLEEEDPDWSTMPEELLEHIGKMLPSRRYALQFRSICPAWRAGLPFARYIAPLLMLPYDRDSPDCAVTFYTVADCGETTFSRNLPSLRGKALRGSLRGKALRGSWTTRLRHCRFSTRSLALPSSSRRRACPGGLL